MKKVIFGAVLYKQAQPYLQEFINSIKSQTCDNFELLFLNDNYGEGKLGDALADCGLKAEDYTVVETGQKYSPAMLRVELLLEAKKLGGDLLIIGDADDTFMANRFEKLVKAFEDNSEAAFFYNDLVDENSNPVFNNLPEDTKETDLINSNFLGMSITAINLNKLSNDWIKTLREGDTHIFDWYLFERLMLDIGFGVYVKNTGTIYRQHEGNIAGNQSTDFSMEYLEKEKRVKIEHYTIMAKRYECYEKYIEAIESIDLNKITPVRGGFWWSKIRI